MKSVALYVVGMFVCIGLFYALYFGYLVWPHLRQKGSDLSHTGAQENTTMI